VNAPLVLALGYLYLIGAWITWWIVDESVEGREFTAALWFVVMPIQILGEQLGKMDNDE
jgi:hypothetical protein